MQSPQKKIYFVILILCLLGIFFLILEWKKIFPEKSISEQRIETVQLGNVQEVVTAQGKLEPKIYVDIGTQVSGQLKKLYVEVGQTVSANTLLAEIDSRIYASRVEVDSARIQTLKAQISEQKVQLELAEKKLTFNQEAEKTGAISKMSLAESQALVLSIRSKIDALFAQVRETQSIKQGDRVNLGYTKIFAPIAGVVVKLNVTEGQTINSSQIAPTLLQLAQLDVMTVRAQVAEADISRIRERTRVYFTTLGALENRFYGQVRQILPAPEIVNDVVLYPVLIDTPNRERLLMTGMSTQVFFILGEAKNVPILSIDALLGRLPAEDKLDINNEPMKAYRVKLITNKEVREQTIHTGWMDRSFIEIKSGLQVGDRVMIPARNKKPIHSSPASPALPGRR